MASDFGVSIEKIEAPLKRIWPDFVNMIGTRSTRQIKTIAEGKIKYFLEAIIGFRKLKSRIVVRIGTKTLAL